MEPNFHLQTNEKLPTNNVNLICIINYNTKNRSTHKHNQFKIPKYVPNSIHLVKELHKLHDQKDEHRKIEDQSSRGQRAPHNRTQDHKAFEQGR